MRSNDFIRIVRNGVIARTIVFDELVKDFINKNPDCTVVNIACGLDTRVYRMDNGRLTWYNLDLPETIAVRNQLYQEAGRISCIGISVLDPAWAKAVKPNKKMLFIIEGLSMYLTAEQNAQMLKIIHDNILRGMRVLVPAQKLIDWLPIAKKMTQKILVFERES